MPEGFYFGSVLHPQQSSDSIAAVNLSLVTLATLGFGDVIPADPGLRLLTPLESLSLAATLPYALRLAEAGDRSAYAADHRFSARA